MAAEGHKFCNMKRFYFLICIYCSSLGNTTTLKKRVVKNQKWTRALCSSSILEPENKFEFWFSTGLLLTLDVKKFETLLK